MAIAFDASSASGSSTADPIDFTHTPVGTPKGVFVFVASQNPTGADMVTGVTYGGVAMTEVTGSPSARNGAGDANDYIIHTFFLGAAIPTGAQTVSVNMSASGTAHFVNCVTVTAASDTAVEDTTIAGPVGDDPITATLTTAVTTFCIGICATTADAVTDIAVDASSTLVVETDLGSCNYSIGYETTNPAAGSPVLGWTTNAAAAASIIAVAIKESATPVTATIVAILDEVSASLNAQQRYLATIVSTPDEVRASLNAYMRPDATIVSTIDEVIAALNAQQRYLTTVDSDLDEVTASLNLAQSHLVTIDSDIDEVQAALQAELQPSVTIAATLDEIIASLAAQQPYLVTIASTLDEVSASLSATNAFLLTINSVLDEEAAALFLEQRHLLTVGATLDEVTASLLISMFPLVTVGATLDELMASLHVDSADFPVRIGATLDEVVAALRIIFQIERYGVFRVRPLSKNRVMPANTGVRPVAHARTQPVMGAVRPVRR